MNNTITSNRKEDIILESFIGSIMDKIYKKNNFNTERVYDALQQKKGVDVIFRKGNKEFYIDEKAAIKYYNKNLLTFSFELASTLNIGWFSENNNFVKTTHYILIYPKATKRDLSDLYEIEYILISKKKLWQYLKSINFPTEKDIIEKLKNIPVNKYGKKQIIFSPEIKIVYSLNIIPEKPLNIVINKNLLYKLSYLHKTIKIKKSTH